MSDPSSPPMLKAPPLACDCHMHVYGPQERYPLAPSAPFPPPPTSVEDYRRVQARLGLERVIVVQPSAYATDNRCTMDAVAGLDEAARAVVVVDTAATDDELQQLTRDGARGIRFHMLKGGVLPWDILDEMASRVHDFGWHVQLQLDGRELPGRMATLERLPGTLVIDHIGKFLEPVPPEHEAFRCLLRLVETGRVWVKLSAPYETSKVGPPRYDDVGTLARTLVKAAPERMLWATNWPHPGQTGERYPDDAQLLDLLLHWADDDATRQHILCDNPAALYGF